MTDGNTIFRHACALGLEGVVAKRRDRPDRSQGGRQHLEIAEEK
jgi:ATP-dependent DNA ligase